MCILNYTIGNPLLPRLLNPLTYGTLVYVIGEAIDTFGLSVDNIISCREAVKSST